MDRSGQQMLEDAAMAGLHFRGTLTTDSVERGGLFLVLDSEPTRYALLLARPLQLLRDGKLAQDGEIIAAPGDLVEITGGWADDIASTRQQGRVLRVMAVRRVERPRPNL